MSSEPVYISDENVTEQVTEQVIEQVTEQVEKLLLKIKNGEYSTNEIMKQLGLKHRPTFLYQYLQPALKLKLLEMTIPEKPKSSLQKYRLTDIGKLIK